MDKVRSHSMAAQHGASRGCRHRRVAAAAGCIIRAHACADHACGNRTLHAAAGVSWPTTKAAHGQLAGIDGHAAADTTGAGNTLLHLPASPACAVEWQQHWTTPGCTPLALAATSEAAHAEVRHRRHVAAAAGITCKRTCVLCQLAGALAQVCCIYWRRPATSRRTADRIGIHMAGRTRHARRCDDHQRSSTQPQVGHNLACTVATLRRTAYCWHRHSGAAIAAAAVVAAA